MNDMEKKIAQRGKQRQDKLTPEERKEIEALATRLQKDAKKAQETELREGKGNGKVKKGSKSGKVDKADGKGKQPAAKSAKKPEAKAPKSNPKTPVGEDILTTKEVAAMVGTTPKALRRVLRAKWYNDGVTTNYRWSKDDPILQEILDHYTK